MSAHPLLEGQVPVPQVLAVLAAGVEHTARPHHAGCTGQVVLVPWAAGLPVDSPAAPWAAGAGAGRTAPAVHHTEMPPVHTALAVRTALAVQEIQNGSLVVARTRTCCL